VSDPLLAAEFIGGAIVSLLVISNPVSTSAVFISLTQDMTRAEKLRTVKKSVTYSLFILIFFSLTGLLLFQIFGFSIGAFRIAGGILLFTTAVGMLDPAPSDKAAREAAQDIAIIPLSIPFTSGPGTIVTVVVLMSEAQNIMQTHDLLTGSLSMLGVYIGIGAVIVISYFMMVKSDNIDRVFREGGRKVITKLMGLLVMAISIQFIITGIKDVLPEFSDALMNGGEIIGYLLFH